MSMLMLPLAGVPSLPPPGHKAYLSNTAARVPYAGAIPILYADYTSNSNISTTSAHVVDQQHASNPVVLTSVQFATAAPSPAFNCSTVLLILPRYPVPLRQQETESPSVLARPSDSPSLIIPLPPLRSTASRNQHLPAATPCHHRDTAALSSFFRKQVEQMARN